MEERSSGPESSVDQAAIDRAAQLVRQARLAQQRGQTDVARKLREEALQLAPDSAEVVSAVAEDAYARRNFKAARDLFEKAKELDPKNVHYERMFGECVLKVTELEHPELFLASPEFESVGSGKIAVILSLFFPGVGQLVTGKRTTGSIMLLGWLLGLAITLMIPNGVAGLLGLFGVKRDSSASNFNGLVLLPLAMMAVFALWSLFDAAQNSGRVEKRKIERPVPPVDKPYEI